MASDEGLDLLSAHSGGKLVEIVVLFGRHVAEPLDAADLSVNHLIGNLNICVYTAT